MYFGLVGLLFQFTLMKPILEKLHMRNTFIMASAALTVYLCLLPMASAPYWFNNYQASTGTSILVWCLLFSIATAGSIGKVVLIPTLSGILSNVHDIHKYVLILYFSICLAKALCKEPHILWVSCSRQ